MSLFNFLTEQQVGKKKKQGAATGAPNVSTNTAIDKFYPRSFDDVASIIDLLCAGKPVIVYLNALKDATAQRVTDLLSGAVYALKGNIGELEKGVYILTPKGIKL
ncbi:MAG: cell division protein SepF [Clostridia bacterium]|nr:cell division protein SepF [Clostridia bacterium]